ncbi:GAF domain-containing protein [Halobaculum sp. MBLA0147]|uniref:GAF domain-containing protein n=1 Tax=Halobaculum sp. MBLA0147 TaxID=3079934 RepID=UPI0035261DCD
MGREVSVLVVGDADTADALAGRADLSVVATDRESVADALAPEHDVVVVVDEPLVEEATLSTVESLGVPVVFYGAERPTASWLDGFVRRTDDGVGHLVDELHHAVAGETRLQLREHRRQLATLHDGAAELAAVRTVQELYDRTLDVARDVLSFDHGLLLVRSDDTLETVAHTPGEWAPEREPTGGSLAGETLSSGAPTVVDDIAADDRGSRHGVSRSVLSVPVGDDAVVQFGSEAPNGFGASDVEAAQLLATHVEETRDRLVAEADARTRRERIAALHRAATNLIDADDPETVYERTVGIAADVLRLDGCVLAEATDDEFVVLADADTVDDPGDRLTDRGHGVLERTYETGEAVLVDDVRADEHAEPTDDSYRAALSVPFGDVGVFQAAAAEPGAYDETDRELAELLVSYATTTLERIASERALRESQSTIERLHEAATRVAAADDEAAVVDRAMAAAKEVLAFDLCTLDLVDESGERLHPAATSDDEAVESESSDVEEGGLAGKTFREGETFVVDDLAADDDADPTKREYRSAISVPVGRVGVFQAVSTETGAFDDDDVDRAELLMAHVAVSLERVRAEDGLRDERDRLSALFENIPDAVVSFEMTDEGPIVENVNAAFEATFGYEAATLRGENLDEYIVPPADTEISADADTLNERLRAGENVRHECRRRTADGIRDFLMYVVPLELGTENVAGYAIYSDITDRKERERELRRQNERLDEFASVVSHDLRNPISIADGWLDMARRTGDEEHFDRVQDAIDRMDVLVDDLLTLAREGEVVGDPEPVEVAAVAEEAWSHVDTARATLETGDAVGVTVEADPDRLSELFENLYRNAVEHGGTDVVVRVREAPGGFAVADDGPGVPEADRESVFDAGVTTSEDGTGFGLPIVKRIAEAHGWRVTLDDSWADGARFVFTDTE